MRLFSTISIGVRLAGAFTCVCLCLLVAVAIGLWGQNKTRNATDGLAAVGNLRRDAMVVKFRTADFNGWQNGYALDIVRGVNGATDDNVGSRAKFLASTTAFRDDLATVQKYRLTSAEQTLLTSVSQSFEQFMSVDQQAIAAYRAGTASGRARADTLISGPAVTLMGQIFDAVDRLTALTTDDANQAKNDADHDSTTARTLMIVVGLICLAVAALLAVLVTRSITVPLRSTVDALRDVAAKDLTVRAPQAGRDELATMGRAVNEHSTTIAAAVEEQTATTAEMSRNIVEAATGSGEIAENVSGVAAAAQITADGVAEAQETASQLELMSRELNAVVTQFRV